MIHPRRKIAVVTATRAEYGLLYYLMREIQNDLDLELQLIVTGMHLSPEFGLTYKLIEKDGFNIHTKVEILMSSDTAVGVAKSIGLGIISFSDVFSRLTPDIIIILGDRFELLSVAEVALVQKIPIAHIHGGELSAGAIDDSIRHAITKMAHLHFVAADAYRKRVIQLGENPDNVHNVGAPGLERIKKMDLLNRQSLEEKLGLCLSHITFLITYHPATVDINDNINTIEALLNALDDFPMTNLIFTKSNADEAGRFLNAKIDNFVTKNKFRAIAYTTLGDLNYLSLLQFVDVIIGNSSSGLTEAPYFQKPTVNIGSRQNGRLKAKSVIDCQGNKNEIVASITKALSNEFKLILKNTISPYTQDETAFKIKEIVKYADLKNLLVKRFNDL